LDLEAEGGEEQNICWGVVAPVRTNTNYFPLVVIITVSKICIAYGLYRDG